VTQRVIINVYDAYNETEAQDHKEKGSERLRYQTLMLELTWYAMDRRGVTLRGEARNKNRGTIKSRK